MGSSHSQFCSYCQLPFLSLHEKDNFCSYGCCVAKAKEGPRSQLLYLLGGAAFSFAALIIALLAELTTASRTINITLLVLSTASYILIIPPLFRQAWYALRRNQVATEQLSFLAPTTALAATYYLILNGYSHDYFEFLALYLLVLPMVSYVEAVLRHRSLEDLHEVLKQRVGQARLVRNNSEVMVETSSLIIGDRVRVKAGEAIPCDGVIVEGTTRVDETRLTGRSEPQFKTRGNQVLAGAFNQDGAILIRVNKPFEENFLERLIRHMDEARSRQSKTQDFVNSCLTVGVISVAVSAIAAFIYWQNQLQEPVFGPTLAILAIPVFSAMSRAIPMGINFGMGGAFHKGIFLGSGEALLRAAKIDSIFFDKTGVISNGDFRFSQLFLEPGVNQGDVLCRFFSLAVHSTHPVARGIETHPWFIEISRHPIHDFKSHPGLGMCGTVHERGKPPVFVAVGNMRFLRRFQMQISPAMREKIDLLETIGETAIVCGWGGNVRAVMSLADNLRTDVKEVLDQLTRSSFRKVLITGDHEEMISHLSRTQGFDYVYTRCLPEEKIARLRKFEDEGYKVGYVGTRSDDFSLLNEASVSFVFNAHTSQLSDKMGVVIYSEKLGALSTILTIAKKSYRIIRMNLSLGLVFSVAGVVLSFLGYIHAVAALLSMASMTLVLNLTPLKLKKLKLEGLA